MQEGRAEQAAAAIQGMLSSKATVIRGGERKMIDAKNVVPGDVCFIQSGDRCPADLRMIEVRCIAYPGGGRCRVFCATVAYPPSEQGLLGESWAEVVLPPCRAASTRGELALRWTARPSTPAKRLDSHSLLAKAEKQRCCSLGTER